jgi:hypothetical protein
MKREEHEKISLAMFGEKHRKVHEFLDQFFPKYGIYHRVVLHHQLGISLVVQKFSGAVRPVAEQHIIDDMGNIPNDFREFDFEFQYADSWLPGNDLMADLRQLYPGWI